LKTHAPSARDDDELADIVREALAANAATDAAADAAD
jgi:hypothetical protein